MNAALRAWAERFHATCEALPGFKRLAVGDTAAAAAATETILGLIDPSSSVAARAAEVPGPALPRSVCTSNAKRYRLASVVEILLRDFEAMLGRADI